MGEYAESDSIIGALQMIGVDFAQGYAVQRPVPLPVSVSHATKAQPCNDLDRVLPLATQS